MTIATLRIATRKSPLALWQAEHVRSLLAARNAKLQVELVEFTTQGDKILNSPLAAVGGKGLFVKELEQALLDRRADIAVHSMKDVPVELPPGLCLSVILAREDPSDSLVSNKYGDLQSLSPGARLGTSSLRRQCQLRSTRPDLDIVTLRGNVGTRLRKLDDGEYDAIILATAGLKRLGFDGRIRQRLQHEISLPAIGQGAIGIECRSHDPHILELIMPLNDPATQQCVAAERALNRRLEGGCQAPIAGHAVFEDDSLYLRGLVGTPDGTNIIQGSATGDRHLPDDLGERLADDLLQRGAADILQDLYAQ